MDEENSELHRRLLKAGARVEELERRPQREEENSELHRRLLEANTRIAALVAERAPSAPSHAMNIILCLMPHCARSPDTVTYRMVPRVGVGSGRSGIRHKYFTPYGPSNLHGVCVGFPESDVSKIRFG